MFLSEFFKHRSPQDLVVLRRREVLFLLLVIGCWLLARVVLATDYSSTTFTVRDPVIDTFGQNTTSTNFQLINAGGQVAIGQSTSTSFILRAGFLYFTDTTSTFVTVTINKNGNGTGTVTGGSGINCGTVCSVSVAAGTAITLTATAYKDSQFTGWSGGNCSGTGTCSITPSTNMTITATFNLSGGGGPLDTGISFSGWSYLSSAVILLKDAQFVNSFNVPAGGPTTFNFKVNNLSAGTYNFSLYARDRQCRQSSLVNYSVALTDGQQAVFQNIVLPPTIVLNKSEVEKGKPITAFGYSVTPTARVDLFTDNVNRGSVLAEESNGLYTHYLDTTPLIIDQYLAQTQTLYQFGALVSELSRPESFIVGGRDVLKDTGSACGQCQSKGDLNSDCQVDLVDFSIAAFWWQQPLSVAFKIVEAERLSGDGIIDLVDFSIMAYYWTGSGAPSNAAYNFFLGGIFPPGGAVSPAGTTPPVDTSSGGAISGGAPPVSAPPVSAPPVSTPPAPASPASGGAPPGRATANGGKGGLKKIKSSPLTTQTGGLVRKLKKSIKQRL